MSYKKTLSLNEFTPISNYVLVRPLRKDNELVLSDKQTIFIDPSWEREKHAPSAGIVIKTPAGIYFNDKDANSTAEYETDQELLEGDTVVFHYLCFQTAIERRQCFTIDGEIYLLIKYDQIFLAKRGDNVIPINGWLIIEPDDEDINIGTLIKPDQLLNRKSLTHGTIRFAGSMVRAYASVYTKDKPFDTDEVSIGDHVTFSKEDSIPLQYELHQIIEKGKVLYRAQRKDILTVNN